MTEMKGVVCLVKIRMTEWIERLEMVKDLLKEKDNFKKNTSGGKFMHKNAVMPHLIDAVQLAIDYIQSQPMVKPAMKMEKVLEEFLKELGGLD